MNPNSATVRSTDLCALLGVTDQSAFRWLSNRYPIHVWTNRARHYALPEIVARLRDRRKHSLAGKDLAAVVAHDRSVRAQRGNDDLWLDLDAHSRSKAFYNALDDNEAERAQDVLNAIRRACAAAGVPCVERLMAIALIHPGAVRFILSGEADELPATDTGWQSFARALWAVNPPTETENREAA